MVDKFGGAYLQNNAGLSTTANPVVDNAQNKLNTALTAQQTAPLQPLSTPTYTAPTANSTILQPQNNMSLNDFITEAQKLGTQQFQSQADIMAQSNKALADTMSRQLYSQNVGASSGVGKEVQLEALKRQTEQLAPYAQQVATQTAQQELAYQYQNSQQQEQRKQNLFSGILSGQIDKSQMSAQDYASMGITDPNAVKTVQQLDLSNAMISQGLDPNSPQDQTAYRTQLRNQYSNTLRQNIISSYAQANDGQIPTSDEINVLMLMSGQGTGVLTPEEEQALTSQYNSSQWNEKLQRAHDKAEASKTGSVICTELNRQGIMSDEIYASDHIFGLTLSQKVRNGYKRFALPLVSLMQNSKLFTKLISIPAMEWAKEMHFKVSGEGKGSIIGRLILIFGVPLCNILGREEKVLCQH